ncbi:thioredoxin family protein [Reinekea thalattae]|uniref:thioredoxin family protein n=1 Tax=Reinekea thalattae TaxID=2593301 RepID=UPI00319D92E0
MKTIKTIKVLGSGCKSCVATAELIKQAADSLAVEIDLQKVDSPADIMAYGVMSTPAVVIDEKIVHAGGIPKEDDIKSWLK